MGCGVADAVSGAPEVSGRVLEGDMDEEDEDEVLEVVRVVVAVVVVAVVWVAEAPWF